MKAFTKNFQHLAGNMVVVFKDKKEEEGFVVGCSYKQGITIQKTEPEEGAYLYSMCLNKKLWPQYQYTCSYDDAFLLLLTCCYAGFIDEEELRNELQPSINFSLKVSQAPCAFE